QLAIGIHRDSSGNVSVDVIAVRGEEEAEAAEISPQVEQENAFSNTWWYERIPLDDRMSPSPYRTLFEGTPPGKPSFQSGYSLYRLYEFQREINQLHDSGRDIGLNLEGQALIIQQEEHFFEPNTSSVEISIRINGHDEKFKLFSGTDLIEIVGPSTPLSTSKKEQSQGAAKVRIPLSQYLARIQDMVGKKGADGLQMRRHSATGKEAPAPKKGEKAPAPAPVPDEEELIAAGLS
ncbi:MAG: hypothetical protein U1C97_02540, partial [Candidatus Gracilibacteria bacterium]|nr:hypothetical protein [Candidatus Gracilibacteria bacterium]